MVPAVITQDATTALQAAVPVEAVAIGALLPLSASAQCRQRAQLEAVSPHAPAAALLHATVVFQESTPAPACFAHLLRKELHNASAQLRRRAQLEAALPILHHAAF